MDRAALRGTRAVVGVNEITQMLIDGGYFRAKISSLPEFDRVAGGLAWGILNSRFSIDVEFVENAAIRDKIRIAEDICKALKSEMGCPHDLEPHQIQGLDYPKIALVLTWLLKRVAAAREENAYFVKEHTKAEFRRRFGGVGFGGSLSKLFPKTPSEQKRLQKMKNITNPSAAPKRVMKSDPNATFASISEHASAVLLEYGFKYQLRDSMLMMEFVDQEVLDGDAEMQREQAKAEDDERKENAMLENLLSTMQDHHEKAKMTNATLANVMATTDNEKLEKLKRTYEKRRQELAEQLAAEEAERNAVESQKQRLQELLQEQEGLGAQEEELNTEVETAKGELEAIRDDINARKSEMESEAQRVDDYERLLRGDEQRAAELDELMQMMAEKEHIAKRIKKDKADGKKRVLDAKEECVEIAERLEHLNSEEADAEFQQEIDALVGSLADLQSELAKRDQEAMGVLRQIDEYPSRAELHQYETRINELNEEVAWKFQDTRLMFNHFNTRAEVSKCLANEEKIVVTLQRLFEEALAEKKAKVAAASRATLLEQIDTVISQLAGSVTKQKEKKETEYGELAKAREGYEELRTRQEKYTELLKSFKDAMALNDMLQQEIADLGLNQEVEEEEEEEQDTPAAAA